MFGGISGYDASECTDENPERVAALRALVWASRMPGPAVRDRPRHDREGATSCGRPSPLSSAAPQPD